MITILNGGSDSVRMVIKAQLEAPVYLFTYTLNDIIAVEDLKSRQYLKNLKQTITRSRLVGISSKKLWLYCLLAQWRINLTSADNLQTSCKGSNL